MLGLMNKKSSIGEDGKREYTLPTGLELMSRPIVDPGLSRKDREILFVIENVQSRLDELVPDSRFQMVKGVLFVYSLICVFLYSLIQPSGTWFVIGVLSAVVGMVIIFAGLGYTHVFERNKFNLGVVIFGGAFGLPLFTWFIYVFVSPLLCRRIADARRIIHTKRKERKKPTLFNDMVQAAQDFTKPPIKYIRIVVLFKKKEYFFNVSTLEDLQQKFYEETGLAPHRQLIKYKGSFIPSHPIPSLIYLLTGLIAT